MSSAAGPGEPAAICIFPQACDPFLWSGLRGRRRK